MKSDISIKELVSSLNEVPILNGDINIIKAAVTELLRIRKPKPGQIEVLESIAEDAITLNNAIYNRLEKQFDSTDSTNDTSALNDVIKGNPNSRRRTVSLAELESSS